MAEKGRMTAAQVVDKVMGGEHVDVVRESVAWLVGELMDAEQRVPAAAVADARGRNRAGDPQAAPGQLLPVVSGAAQASEQALVAVVQEAYVNGVSTRKVDRLVEQLGVAGMRKDAVSRLCRGLDEQVRVLRR